ncbi:hypothetical protein GCM10022232_30510 [Streptomyces plumbiresistens]|uniref:Uncharacterized protein n=1 Tax=Streptomyces plumbiresistens TaxID=511811 RepID=A0ABP7R6C0_9ACTN
MCLRPPRGVRPALRRISAGRPAGAEAEVAFGPPTAGSSPAMSPSRERDSAPTYRQLAERAPKKFLSESLTHPEALRNLCQQALT